MRDLQDKINIDDVFSQIDKILRSGEKILLFSIGPNL